ncbi:unnamed protein product [Psylliodes chrysocephalus]|uniref:Thioredoxin domain-containing protein n=1 Tax=Psylliodes chrysocephalus TaxID=3402493 RepID=A0A9P0G9T4_9CUCU|nr:unnamed protein product [Psylliodes chrysocephala]
MKKIYFIVCVLFISFPLAPCTPKSNKKSTTEDIADIKDFKKLLRTKTNILACFYNSFKESQHVIKLFRDVTENIKGEGTMVIVDCSGSAKKMCKKLKISESDPFTIKHYKDGDFNKAYDRKLTVSSMTNFMRDPTGDIPWEEDSSAVDVVHIPDSNTLLKLIKKEPRPLLIMFYAPWCSFCKTLKPEYADAAKELKDDAVLAAIDVNRPENTAVRSQYNITGFPTLLFFENGRMKFTYEGENKKNGLVSFMRNPTAPPVRIKEPEWSDVDNDVVHLTTTSFDPVIKEEASVLVMFYAPWCGHCKKMKPEYEAAAARMKNEGIPGMLAAVDATKEPTIASRFSVKGYPTVIYFSFGEQKFDINVRDAPKIIEFMREPKEPPPPPPPEQPWADEETDIVHLSEESFKQFLKKKKHVLVMFYAPWCGHCKRAKPEFTSAAAEFKDDPKVEFAAVDCTVHPAVCTANDVSGYPTIKYFSYFNKNTKDYKGGRTATEFVSFMKEPDLPPTPLSTPEPAPEWQIDPSILKLTDSNFKQQLQKNDIVLVMFYAPWCGYCNKMKPDYFKAAKDLSAKGYPQCMAMVDCTENPTISDEYNISGFPTLKLFKNGKFVMDYTGKRTHEDLKEFVLKYIESTKGRKDEL